MPRLFRSRYNSAQSTLNVIFSKPYGFEKITFKVDTPFPKAYAFENGVHDYSKMNERINLKLDILLKNMIIFYMNIK